MKKRTSTKDISARKFDEKFDSGKSVMEHLDVKKAVVIKRVNLDLPGWAVKALDAEASRRGIARQALIKTWLIDKLDIIMEKKTA